LANFYYWAALKLVEIFIIEADMKCLSCMNTMLQSQ